jgi:hypothetical protein
MDHIVGGKFKLGKKIGSGSFGELFLAVNAQTGEEVAVKLKTSRRSTRSSITSPSSTCSSKEELAFRT